MFKFTVVTTILVALAACALDPVAYEENRNREHQEHLQQNGY